MKRILRLPMSRARLNALLAKPVQYLMETGEVDVRTCNYLNEHGVWTIRDLLHTDPADLTAIAGFGDKTLRAVMRALNLLGISRADMARSVA